MREIGERDQTEIRQRERIIPNLRVRKIVEFENERKSSLFTGWWG